MQSKATPEKPWSAVLLYRADMGEDSVAAIAGYMKNKVHLVRNKLDPVPVADICIRWGCTGNTGIKRVLNTAGGIHRVYDKPAFRRTLGALAPKLYSLEEVVTETPCPIIIRPAKHTQGKDTYLLQWDYSLENLGEVLKTCGAGAYISEYIEKVREFRIYIVQGRVAFVMEKFPEKKTDVAWDFSAESQWANVLWGNWPIAAVEAAIKAMELAELDFGGVDVVLDKKGTPYVLEVNSAGGVYGNYMAKCVAKCFDYVLSKASKEKIPLGTDTKTKWKYLNYIHPAVNQTN